MQIKHWLRVEVFSALVVLATAAPARAGEWVQCGTLAQLAKGCELASHPSALFEYGLAYGSKDPLAIGCSAWGAGIRVYNQTPFNLAAGAANEVAPRWGGFVFYSGAVAGAGCSNDAWRSRQWWPDRRNLIVEEEGGCLGGELPLFCRAR